LAGPVVAAACFIPFDRSNSATTSLIGIADSKLLNEAEREHIYHLLTTNSSVIYATSIVSNRDIDELNILEASLLAMSRACNDVLKQMEKKVGANSNNNGLYDRAIALVDGNKLPKDIPISTKYVYYLLYKLI
jgi:ribonuclease HII